MAVKRQHLASDGTVKNRYKSSLIDKKLRKRDQGWKGDCNSNASRNGGHSGNRRRKRKRKRVVRGRVKFNGFGIQKAAGGRRGKALFNVVQDDASYGYAPVHKMVTPLGIEDAQAVKQRSLEEKLLAIAKILSRPQVANWSEFYMVCERQRLLAELSALLQDPGYAAESSLDDKIRLDLAKPIKFKPIAWKPPEVKTKELLEKDRFKLQKNSRIWDQFEREVGPEINKHQNQSVSSWVDTIKNMLVADNTRKFEVEPLICRPALERFKNQPAALAASYVTFHGTSCTTVASIKKRGLIAGGERAHDGHRVPVKHGRAYGSGVYSSPSFATALGYVGGSSVGNVFANLVVKPSVAGSITVAPTSHVLPCLVIRSQRVPMHYIPVSSRRNRHFDKDSPFRVAQAYMRRQQKLSRG